MERSLSVSSIPSISSESLNINFGDSLPIKKEKPLKLCLEEFSLINSKLEEKLRMIKQREEQLHSKEKNIITLCNSVNQYIKSEVTKKCLDLINDTEGKYCELTKKFNDLNKDHVRLQCSFETLKSQNKGLKKQLKEHTLTIEMITKDRDKLASRVSQLSARQLQSVATKHKSISVQTINRPRMKDPSVVALDASPAQPYPSLSSITILRELWLQMFHLTMKDFFVVDNHESLRARQSFTDISLLIIPMSIEYLRTAGLSNIDTMSSSMTKKRHLDIVTHHMEMLYWSLVYMDVGRIPLRSGIMTPLTRIGEDMTLMLVGSSSIKKWITEDNEVHSLMVLLALRCVNQVDLLSLVLQYVSDMVTRQSIMATILLSKYLLVPLLCRWTSSATCYSPLYPRILSIVLDVFQTKIHYDSQQCSISLISNNHNTIINNGLDQLVFIITNLFLNTPESCKSSSSHPLEFLIDILHSSDNSTMEKITEVLEQIISNKQVRRLSRTLGIVTVISNHLSQYGESTSPSVIKLRSILAELRNH